MIHQLSPSTQRRQSANAPAYLALNLSYVLHAPSASPQVADFARANRRAAQSIDAALGVLGPLSDAAFGQAIVVAPGAALDRIDPAQPVLSLRLGAWEILPRAVGVIAGARPRVAALFDDPGPNLTPLEFFRGPAELYLPAGLAFPCRFATLICRPGYRSLLLSAALVDTVATLTREAEDAVRRYVDQWRCVRALWQAPAETTLPELAGRV